MSDKGEKVKACPILALGRHIDGDIKAVISICFNRRTPADVGGGKTCPHVKGAVCLKEKPACSECSIYPKPTAEDEGEKVAICSVCSGSGRVYTDGEDGDGKPCPRCAGKGDVTSTTGTFVSECKKICAERNTLKQRIGMLEEQIRLYWMTDTEADNEQ